jgi:hypothetical protein
MRRRQYAWGPVVAAMLVMALSPAGAAMLAPPDLGPTIQSFRGRADGQGIIMLVPGYPGCRTCGGEGIPPAMPPFLPPLPSPPPATPPPADPPSEEAGEDGPPDKGPDPYFWWWPSTEGAWPI